MITKHISKSTYALTILLFVLFLGLAACGSESPDTGGEIAAPAVENSEENVVAEQDTEQEIEAEHSDDEAEHEEGEAVHSDDEAVHEEGEEGHEDMAVAHGIPEEFVALENPVPTTQASIARGAELFQVSCAVCHGDTGQGDGVGAAGLDPKPANLGEAHVQENTDGSLFYTISKGVEGTAMVAWEDLIAEEDRWHLVNFVRTVELAE